MHKITKSLIFTLALFFVSFSSWGKPPQSIAFYYNNIDSVRELINYERVVVEPSLITSQQIDKLHKAETKVFAYLSVGEYDGATLPKELVGLSPAYNHNWNSHVMNLSAPQWQRHLDALAKELLDKGFDGLFLDTLDSYTLFANTQSKLKQQQKALSTIINGFNDLPHKPILILNRGFEVLNRLTFKPYAVAAESLYNSYNPLEDEYQSVPTSDATWLREKLSIVKEMGIEAIVIDYLPASDRDAQKEAAQQLIREGYTPYISDGLLYEFGVSTIMPVAKRVLGFYDGSQDNLTASPCIRLMAMPIEYLGYVPECQDIHSHNYSKTDITRYAGIFFWLDESSYRQVPELSTWISKNINTVPMLFLNSLPTDKQLQVKLGITSKTDITGKLIQQRGNELTKGHYPAPMSPFEKHQAWVSTKDNVDDLITFINEEGQTTSTYFRAPWGGAVLSPFPVSGRANNSEVWLIDPFTLIDTTLALPMIPAADTTTESGLRILTSHIDGDGFPSKAWFPNTPYTAQVLLEYIFNKYPIPQTVSVIEGEIGARGLYPEQSPEMEKIAREIFRLPNVEIASHTFSHPFFWDKTTDPKNKQYGDNLAIPGYSIDYHNEIVGSTEYINSRLAPKGKKVEVLLWSGNADPSEAILNIAEKAGLYNVNGGNTYVVEGNDNYANISPSIVWYPTAVQVYAPVMNENLYTSLWTEHFDGYERAIETFKILDSPRRLKSISIYYHMYSGAYPASLKGVTKVYDWAIAQPVTPLYLSEYAERAETLYETGIAKTFSGHWQIVTTGIRSIRLQEQMGIPYSKDIAGWNNGPDGHYLILSKPRTKIATTPTHIPHIRLISANGTVMKWIQNQGIITWSIQSHIPLKATLKAHSCKRISGSNIHIKQNQGQVIITSPKHGLLSGKLKCSVHS